MNTIYLNSNDPIANQITGAAYPSYNGRKFKAVVVKNDHKFNLTSGWDGGSRDYYVLVDLSVMKAVDISAASFVGNCFNKMGSDFVLPEGFVIVEHSFFCGKDMGMTIYVTENNATKLIPAKIELTKTEKLVLAATRGLKSSYAGIKNYRQHESGLSPQIWADTVDVLKTKGLLAKNAAITTEGKNAIGSLDLWRVQQEKE